MWSYVSKDEAGRGGAGAGRAKKIDLGNKKREKMLSFSQNGHFTTAITNKHAKN